MVGATTPSSTAPPDASSGFESVRLQTVGGHLRHPRGGEDLQGAVEDTNRHRDVGVEEDRNSQRAFPSRKITT